MNRVSRILGVDGVLILVATPVVGKQRNGELQICKNQQKEGEYNFHQIYLNQQLLL